MWKLLTLDVLFACSIFSDVAGDVTIVVDGESFLLHKVNLNQSGYTAIDIYLDHLWTNSNLFHFNKYISELKSFVCSRVYKGLS